MVLYILLHKNFIFCDKESRTKVENTDLFSYTYHTLQTHTHT